MINKFNPKYTQFNIKITEQKTDGQDIKTYFGVKFIINNLLNI